MRRRKYNLPLYGYHEFDPRRNDHQLTYAYVMGPENGIVQKDRPYSCLWHGHWVRYPVLLTHIARNNPSNNDSQGSFLSRSFALYM